MIKYKILKLEDSFRSNQYVQYKFRRKNSLALCTGGSPYVSPLAGCTLRVQKL